MAHAGNEIINICKHAQATAERSFGLTWCHCMGELFHEQAELLTVRASFVYEGEKARIV